MRRLLNFACIIGITSVPFPAWSDEGSWQLARLGKQAFEAFACSALASEAGQEAKVAVPFNVGVDSARKFIEAIKANRIQQADLTTEVPMIVMWSLQGPSVDFMVGRIYQVSSDYTLDTVSKEADKYADISDFEAHKTQRQLVADLKYRESDCRRFDHM